MDQLVLDGFESFYAPGYAWRPRPHPLACLQSYLMGYATNGREIFPKRSYIVAALYRLYRIRMTVRTLARYLRHLAAIGWIETIRRTARTAYRRITGRGADPECCDDPAHQFDQQTQRNQTAVPSTFLSLLRHPLYYVLGFKNAARAPKKGPSMETGTDLMRTEEGFDSFIGLFLAAGKKLNVGDIVKAGTLWGGLTPDERRLARGYAYDQLIHTKYARFVPFPANFLQNRPWNREGPERTLPYVDPKVDAWREDSRRLNREGGLFSRATIKRAV